LTAAAPAAVLALALLGDALLYVVLPIHAAAFGVSLVWVGVLLAANRFVRIFGYGVIAVLARDIGVRRLSIVASIGAVLSTAAYGLASGPVPLLAARVVWGLAFGALNLTMLAYAVADRTRAGRGVGTGRAVSGFGPVLSLTLGAWLVGPLGPQGVFVALALATVPAVVLAWRLSDLPRTEERRRRGVAWPERLDLWALALGFAVDGVFVLTLAVLLAGLVSAESAVIAGGLLLALRRLVEIFLAPIGGMLGDRFGAGAMMLAFGLALCAGLATVACGWTMAGALLVVATSGVLSTIGPVLAAERAPHDHLGRLAAFATWRDVGAALGPLAAGVLAERVATAHLYAALSLLMLAALALNLRAALATRGPS
jgi:MFS family permease